MIRCFVITQCVPILGCQALCHGHNALECSQGRVPSALLDSQVDPASFEISGHIITKRQQDYEALTQDGIWDLLSYASLSEEAFMKFCHFALDF